MTAAQGSQRERWYARQGGMEGATFAATVLAGLQSAPLDAANYYSMDNQPFGLFTLHGTPKKTFYAIKAFREMLDTPSAVRINGNRSNQITSLAGLDAGRTKAQVMLVHSGSKATEERIRITGLPWRTSTTMETRVLDETHDLEVASQARIETNSLDLPVTLPEHSVVLIKFRPTADETKAR